MALRKSEFLDWQIGTQLMIERQVEDKNQRGSSRLLGVYQQSYLLAELPFSYGMPMFTSTGARCVVRFLNAGTLLGFRSQVVKLSHEPFPLMILEYPRKMEEMTLRKHDRLSCCLPSRMAFLDDEDLKALGEAEAAGQDEAAPETQEGDGAGEEAEAAREKEAEAAVASPEGGEDDGKEEEPAADKAPKAALRRKLDVFYREANIVDLALGGCQVVILTHEAMDINRHKDILDRIPRADRSEYSTRILKREAGQKKKVLLDFKMPEGLGGTVEGSLCSLQWSREQEDYLALGLAFDRPLTERDRAIRFLMDFQSRYFSQQFTTRLVNG